MLRLIVTTSRLTYNWNLCLFANCKHLALWNPTDLSLNLSPITEIELSLFLLSVFDFSRHLLQHVCNFTLEDSTFEPIGRLNHCPLPWTRVAKATAPSEDDLWCQGHKETVECWGHACTFTHLTTLRPEQLRGLKCGHDPADGAFLCGQKGSQLHRGAVKG